MVLLAIGCVFLFLANSRSRVGPDETVSETPVFGPGSEKGAKEQPVAA